MSNFRHFCIQIFFIRIYRSIYRLFMYDLKQSLNGNRTGLGAGQNESRTNSAICYQILKENVVTVPRFFDSEYNTRGICNCFGIFVQRKSNLKCNCALLSFNTGSTVCIFKHVAVFHFVLWIFDINSFAVEKKSSNSGFQPIPTICYMHNNDNNNSQKNSNISNHSVSVWDKLVAHI